MVHGTKSAANMNKLDSHQEIEGDLAPFVAPNLGVIKNITVSRQVVLKAMFETPVLLF